MRVLAIETSCDETAFAVLEGRKVLAAEVASSSQEHAAYGGVVPEMASRFHGEVFLSLLRRTLQKSRTTPQKIDLICATGGPGLLGSILVGVSCAKSLAIAWKKPLVFVDHVLAHGYSGIWETDLKDPYPFVSLVVSGGHTVLLEWRAPDRVVELGGTIDDAAGEAFDKVAKILGYGYPGGPLIEKAAKRGDARAHDFPRPLKNRPDYQMSFSGLKTAVLYRARDMAKGGRLSNKDRASLAASFQEAACEVLVFKALKALREKKARALVVGGGVSANGRLRAMFGELAKPEDGPILFPSKELCSDNAVMIAAYGACLYARQKNKKTAYFSETAMRFTPYTEFSTPPPGVKFLK